jgi:hypothetical protein
MSKIHRTIQTASANLGQAAANIPARYTAGVNAADWATPASSAQAEANYAAGVQKAVTNKTRAAGVNRVGNSAWRAAAVAKGAPVIGSRITASLQKYQTNFQPILSAMNAAADAAPARTLDPVANIQSRLIPVVQAAIAAKQK